MNDAPTTAHPRTGNLRRPVYWAALWLLPFIAAWTCVAPLTEPDLTWHIKMGEWMWHGGDLHGPPSLTFGPHDPNWRTTQWLSELLLYALWRLGGLPLLGLWVPVTTAAVTAVIVWVAYRAAGGATRPVVAARAATVASLGTVLILVPGIEARPVLMSFAFMSVLGLWCFTLLRLGRWPAWWLTGLFTVTLAWLHGSALLVAPALAAAGVLHLAARPSKANLALAARHGIPTILVAAVAPALGPLGLDYWTAARNIQQAATGIIVEWQAPYAGFTPWLLLLAFVGVWAACLIKRRRPLWIVAAETLWVLFLLGASMTASRYVFVAACFMTPLVSATVASTWPRTRRWESAPKRSPLWLLPLLVAAPLTIATAVNASQAALLGPYDPVRILTTLQQSSDDRRILGDYNLGGKIEWFAPPGTVVGIDGRSDRYGNSVIVNYVHMMDAKPGWQETWAKYPGTTDVIVEKTSKIVDELERDGWVRHCEDTYDVWLVRPDMVNLTAPCTAP